MNYQVRKAQIRDLPRILEIYQSARAFMASSGNPNQWGSANPPRETLEEDIRLGDLYLLTEGEIIHGCFAYIPGPDPTYGVIYEGQWHSDRPYGVIHRVAGDGSGGILRAAVSYAEGHSDCLRIDTHEDNKIMQRQILRMGFQRCGIIHLLNGQPRIAFDRV